MKNHLFCFTLISIFFSFISNSNLAQISYKAKNKTTAKSNYLELNSGLDNDYFTDQYDKHYFYTEIKTEQPYTLIKKRTPLNVSIVIDRSGSMSGHKIKYAREAAKHIIDQLHPNDYVSVVIYDHAVDVLYPAAKAENKHLIKQRIDKITERGSTNLMGGALKGYDEVKKNFRENYINRVMLLSDGLANEGITDPVKIEKIINQYNKSDHISISTFGLGSDYNEDLMTSMAESGQGNYYFIEHPEDIVRIFEKELRTIKEVIAKQSILEIALPRSIEIERVYGVKHEIGDNKIYCYLNDIFSNETRSLLIRFRIKNRNTLPIVFHTTFSYWSPSQEKKITLRNTIEQQYTDNILKYNSHHSDWIEEQVAIFESNELAEMALREADKGNYEEAKKIVRKQTEYIQSKSHVLQKSMPLQKASQANAAYNEALNDISTKSESERKVIQKSSKMSSYEVRNKK
jgi:Uncharacterized protein containing a von Willebrand factor type A (vWA) domain